jgi:hypothetical protein
MSFSLGMYLWFGGVVCLVGQFSAHCVRTRGGRKDQR